MANPSLKPPQTPFVATAIYGALAAHDRATAQAFLELYPDTVTDTLEGQIAAANRFWRLQFGQLPMDTTGVRDYLVDRVELNDWLRLFGEQVVPAIVALGLPRATATRVA